MTQPNWRRRSIGAKRPLVVTSAVGRNPAAVPELIKLCERLGIAVLEQSPICMNYPADDALYMGNRWSEPNQEPVLAEADVILVLDSDAPWVPAVSKPSPGAQIFHIDVDPLKQDIPLWYFKAQRVFQADCATALAQINAALDGMTIDAAKVKERKAHYGKMHEALAAQWLEREQPNGAMITPEYFTAVLRKHIDDNTIILSEAITNYPTVANHLRPSRPGSYFLSGGSSLGWHGGAAIGAKLACPGQDRDRDQWRRLIHVLGAVVGALDGAQIRNAVPADHLQQWRLALTEDVDVGGAPRWLCQPRQCDRRRVRAGAGSCRHRRRRRRRLGAKA